MNKKAFLLSAVALAAIQVAAMPAQAETKKVDPKGKCYGIVAAHESECGGMNPVTKESWGCAGQNPTADFGWKKKTQSECDAAVKHKDATAKKFIADKN
ncbi:MAG: hypothetical protein WA160_04410 [Pseudobdellovibrio sp.]